MRGLDAVQRIGAAAVVLLLAAACGDESSGLATLAGTEAPAPAILPEEVEPVSEPTAMTQPVSETTEEIEPLSPAEADPDGTDMDNAAAATTTSQPENIRDEESAEVEGVANEESAEVEGVANEESAEVEDATDEERLLAFAECMRENGVDFPDPVVEADGTVTFGSRPGSGGGGLRALREIGQDPDLPAARDMCGGIVEGLAFGPGRGGFDLIELQDTLLEFARCMRDNGVDMGDPDLSRFGPGANDDDQPGGPFGVVDIDDPDFAAAFAVCQQRLPQAGGPRVGGSG